ncbi:MAG: NUDIX domain-containing protein [Gammaproteobacteria bacterium]|nr:NUDIX domain-containing protein [Gammaproteobacteria bacterium]
MIVTDAERVLFGQRACESGGFEWQLPGGWINCGESPRQAARREVVEETGLQLRDMHFVGITSNIFSASNHSVSLYFEAACVDRRALIVAEPEICRGWEWRQWGEVNNNLFLPLQLLKQTEYRPFIPRNKQSCVAN